MASSDTVYTNKNRLKGTIYEGVDLNALFGDRGLPASQSFEPVSVLNLDVNPAGSSRGGLSIPGWGALKKVGSTTLNALTVPGAAARTAAAATGVGIGHLLGQKDPGENYPDWRNIFGHFYTDEHGHKGGEFSSIMSDVFGEDYPGKGGIPRILGEAQFLAADPLNVAGLGLFGRVKHAGKGITAGSAILSGANRTGYAGKNVAQAIRSLAKGAKIGDETVPVPNIGQVFKERDNVIRALIANQEARESATLGASLFGKQFNLRVPVGQLGRKLGETTQRDLQQVGLRSSFSMPPAHAMAHSAIEGTQGFGTYMTQVIDDIARAAKLSSAQRAGLTNVIHARMVGTNQALSNQLINIMRTRGLWNQEMEQALKQLTAINKQIGQAEGKNWTAAQQRAWSSARAKTKKKIRDKKAEITQTSDPAQVMQKSEELASLRRLEQELVDYGRQMRAVEQVGGRMSIYPDEAAREALEAQRLEKALAPGGAHVSGSRVGREGLEHGKVAKYRTGYEMVTREEYIQAMVRSGMDEDTAIMLANAIDDFVAKTADETARLTFAKDPLYKGTDPRETQIFRGFRDPDKPPVDIEGIASQPEWDAMTVAKLRVDDAARKQLDREMEIIVDSLGKGIFEELQHVARISRAKDPDRFIRDIIKSELLSRPTRGGGRGSLVGALGGAGRKRGDKNILDMEWSELQGAEKIEFLNLYMKNLFTTVVPSHYVRNAGGDYTNNFAEFGRLQTLIPFRTFGLTGKQRSKTAAIATARTGSARIGGSRGATDTDLLNQVFDIGGMKLTGGQIEVAYRMMGIGRGYNDVEFFNLVTSKGPLKKWRQWTKEKNLEREDAVRLHTWVEHLHEGTDPITAMIKTQRTRFDYNKLTHFERVWMRNLFLFYTWTKRNPILWGSVMATRPGVPLGFFRVESNRPKFENEPPYLSEVGLVPTPFGVPFNIGSPYQDVFTYDLGAANLRQKGLGSINPAARVPTELLLNKTAFTGGPAHDESLSSAAQYSLRSFLGPFYTTGTTAVEGNEELSGPQQTTDILGRIFGVRPVYEQPEKWEKQARFRER